MSRQQPTSSNSKEVEMRADFQQKFDKAIGLQAKSRTEYLEQAKREINAQNIYLSDFIKTVSATQ